MRRGIAASGGLLLAATFLTGCGGTSAACDAANTEVAVARALWNEANSEYDAVYEDPDVSLEDQSAAAERAGRRFDILEVAISRAQAACE